jgi:putative ABC transport system permease protein
MLDPRWRKVIGDLWSNKTRTLLVAFSIAIGVFSVGMIAEGRERMLRGLTEPYLAGNPFSAAISTVESFDEDLVEAIERIDGVEVAQGSKSVTVRMNVGPDQWETLQLRAIRDFDDIRVSRMDLEYGPWPPPDNTMLIERSALSDMLGVNVNVGDTLLIETLDQDQRQIPVVGVVHDLHVAPTFIFGVYYGYITDETLEWLGESREFNSMRFMVDRERMFDEEFVTQVSYEVRDKIERSGIEVAEMFIPPEPGRSPIVTFAVDPIIFLMSALGVLAVFLSGFLVTNTISALLAQQIKQIGIMKAVGARTGQIFLMYLVLVLAFGVLALLIGAPLAYIAAGYFTEFFARLFNFNAQTYGIIPSVLAIQMFVSLIIPVMAAIFPVLAGTRVSIREAISSEGSSGGYGSNFIDRAINRIQGVSRPLLLSLRNTFRRKGRLALTLITLTLGGAIFISVFSVQDSINLTLDELFGSLLRYDVQIEFNEEYRIAEVEREALTVPGVVSAESWGSITARRLRPDDTESDTVFFQAPPANTQLVDPQIVEGRWLLPDDENAVVLSASWVNKEPDVAIGDEITLKLKGRETEWVVVGFIQGLGDNLLAYANKDFFALEVREMGTTSTLNVITEYHTQQFQERVAQNLEEHFRAVGLEVSSSTTSAAEKAQSQTQFGIITSLLMIMAVLIAVVGGLGLMGTMSMNVLERTREIGVMRAIGASDGSILSIVITEGILIGMISWTLGAAIAFPVSKVLSDQVGVIFLGTPFSYTYSMFGSLLWLAIAIVLAAIASFLPAWNASRLTVRDVLAYE